MHFPAGWGRLRYFDIGEHLIDDKSTTLAEIPKLGPNWKVIHDFQPTDYLTAEYLDGNVPRGLWVILDHAWESYLLTFPPDGVQLWSFSILGADKLAQSNQLPPIGEWTRIEMTHEIDEEAEKYFISVSVGGREVMKREVVREEDDYPLGQQMGVTICLGDRNYQLPGSIRGLIVLEKP